LDRNRQPARNGTALLVLMGVLGSAALLASPTYAGAVPLRPAPQSITTVAGTGVPGFGGDGGPAVAADLFAPTGISEDAAGTLYIGDTRNNRVRKVARPTSIQNDVITTLAGTGAPGFTGDGGQALNAELSGPTGTAIDPNGDVFIADTGNNRIRKVTPEGVITTVTGDGNCENKGHTDDGGNALRATLCSPTGLALDHQGDLFIADTGHNMVRELTPGGNLVTVAGRGNCPSRGGHTDATGGEATDLEQGEPSSRANPRAIDLCSPTGLAVDSMGNLYIGNTGLSTVLELAAVTHHITTVAGVRGRNGFAGDGGKATSALLDDPTGLAVGPQGDLFVSDTGNNRIRRVTGGMITTFAGNGTRGFAGDGGPASQAELNSPSGEVALDGTALYFADPGNNRVRAIFNGPPPILPETSFPAGLPILGAALLGAAVVLYRVRRRQRA